MKLGKLVFPSIGMAMGLAAAVLLLTGAVPLIWEYLLIVALGGFNAGVLAMGLSQ